MSRYPIGRGVKVEVQNTLGSAKPVSEVTNASPGVATSTSHGLTDGAVGYFSGVTGMTALEGQAVRIDSSDTNTFALEKLKTTSFGDFTGTAQFTPVSTWHTVGNVVDFQTQGGQSSDADETTVIDEIDVSAPGRLSPQSVQFNARSAFESAAMLVIEQAAFDQAALVFRVTFKDGQQRVFRGIPSVSDENVGLGQSVVGAFSVKVQGRVLRLPAL